MTGWRLGWLLVPQALRRAVDCLTGNFTICPPVLSQIAAVAAFTPESIAEADGHLQHYAANRELLLNGLRDIGIDRLAPTDGAFYVYADVSDFTARLAVVLREAAGRHRGCDRAGYRLRHRARRFVRPAVVRRAHLGHRRGGGRASRSPVMTADGSRKVQVGVVGEVGHRPHPKGWPPPPGCRLPRDPPTEKRPAPVAGRASLPRDAPGLLVRRSSAQRGGAP